MARKAVHTLIMAKVTVMVKGLTVAKDLTNMAPYIDVKICPVAWKKKLGPQTIIVFRRLVP